MIRLEGVTRRSYSAVLLEVAEAIGGCGGWVVSHQLFSNVMIMVSFEIPGDQMAALADALTRRQVSITGQSDPAAPADTSDVRGQLTITVMNEGPDMRRTVPAFG